MWKKKKKEQNFQEDDLLKQSQNINFYDDNYQDDYDYETQLQKLYHQNKKRTRDKEYYVKGSELKAQIEKYQKSKREDAEKRGVPYEEGVGQISQELGEMIIKICERFSRHPRFFGYSFRDEFVADAVARCITHGVDKIDLSLPNCNPFAYFTQISYNQFRQKIKRQKRYNQVKQRLQQEVYSDFTKDNNLERAKQNQDQI